MYGSHIIPTIISHEEARLELEASGKKIVYRRFLKEQKIVEKIIIGNKKKILISPVEPLLLPKEISTHFMIEFSQPITLEPHIKHDVYLTFPIEIGVYVQNENHDSIIDVFSFNEQKYTLYGDPRQGVVCRYWKSEVYFEEPELAPLHFGIVKLRLENNTSNWVDVSRCVLNAFGIKIFYNEVKVLIEAEMKVIDAAIAEVEVFNKTTQKKMVKAHELITRKISLGSNRFVMLEGI